MHYPLPPTSHVRRYRLAQAECCVYLAAMIRVDQSRTLFTLAVLVAALWGILLWLQPSGFAVVLYHPAPQTTDSITLTDTAERR